MIAVKCVDDNFPYIFCSRWVSEPYKLSLVLCQLNDRFGFTAVKSLICTTLNAGHCSVRIIPFLIVSYQNWIKLTYKLPVPSYVPGSIAFEF